MDVQKSKETGTPEALLDTTEGDTYLGTHHNY